MCVCASVCDIFVHISYAYLRSTLYISYGMSVKHKQTTTAQDTSIIAHDMKGDSEYNEYNRLKRGFELHVAAFASCKKTWKRFCFKKNLKQRWGVVVSFNVRKHMSYKASLSRRKDSSEFSTNWWKLRTALGKQFTSHIISPRPVERRKRENGWTIASLLSFAICAQQNHFSWSTYSSHISTEH